MIEIKLYAITSFPFTVKKRYHSSAISTVLLYTVING